MSKISVFGGTGFIGGTFCRLYPLDVDIISKQSIEFNTTEILYFISTTTNQNVFNDLHVDIDTNLNFLINVLSNCKDKDITFNFISSGFVYGNDIIDAKETDCCNPTGFYSITKRCAEQLLISFCQTFGIKYRILRIGNVYGLDKTISPGKNVLAYMIGLLKSNEDIKLYEGGKFLKDYMFVEDICRAIKIILEKSSVNEIYNISSGTSMMFVDIIKNLKNMFHSKSNIIDIPFSEEQKYIQVKNMTLDNTKLKSIGFKPVMNIKSGLQMMSQIL